MRVLWLGRGVGKLTLPSEAAAHSNISGPPSPDHIVQSLHLKGLVIVTDIKPGALPHLPFLPSEYLGQTFVIELDRGVCGGRGINYLWH